MPTNDKKRWGLPHTLRPDSDNLAKLVLDSLMRAGLFKDDSAVSCLVARKTWSPSPLAGVAITIGPDRRVSLPQPTGPAWLA
jgi:Holliday junction resolvase RusA-like endonuclease